MSGEFAGLLAERVQLLPRQAARDDLGGGSDAWGDPIDLRAAIGPMTAAGWGQGDLPAAAPRWRATIRRGVAVASGDRLAWRGLRFAVRSVQADPAAPDRLTLVLEQLP